MSVNNDLEDNNEAPADLLDFDPKKLAAHIVQWSIDPKFTKQVKQGDRDEIEFLSSMLNTKTLSHLKTKKDLEKDFASSI